MKLINKGIKPLIVYQISKEEVLNCDLKGLDRFFKTINRLGIYARGEVSILCGGYDDVPDELHHIEEVRKFVAKMFKRFPYLLYYINRETESDHWLLNSFADEITSVFHGDPKVTEMTPNEIFDKFGTNLPRVESMLTFEDGKLADILRSIIKLGEKLGDRDNARSIAMEYAKQFNVLEIQSEIGGDKWRR